MAKTANNYFPKWFRALEALAQEKKFPLDVKHKMSYQEYFDDKYSPEETLKEEMDRASKEKTVHVLEQG